MDSFGFCFAAALLTALLVTPLIRRIAVRHGLADAPGLRKLHQTAVPDVGGAAFVMAMLVGLAAFLAMAPEPAALFLVRVDQGLAVVVAVVVMFGVGFLDDLRGLRVRHKLAAQILVGIGLCAAGVRLEQLSIAGSVNLEFGWLSWPLTVFWLVGLTNALNLIDGIDGLAASLGVVGCAVLAWLGIDTGQLLLAGMSLAMLGALLGFLVFNFHPAKIFMGDGGSLALGMFLASGAVLSLAAKPSHSYPWFALPCLAMGIPILDATYCIVRRILDRRSPFAPDRGHIHHRMLDLGLGHRQIVLLMLGVTVLATGLGAMMLFYQQTARFIILVAAGGILVLFLWGVGYFQFRKTLRSLWQMHSLGRERRQAQRGFETLQLQMREVESFADWWTVVCNAAAAWEFASVEIDVEHRDGPAETLAWQSPTVVGVGELGADRLELSMPIAQRREDQPLHARVAIWTGGSLESAAARFRLFARLIDEHSVATLVPREGASGGEPANTA